MPALPPLEARLASDLAELRHHALELAQALQRRDRKAAKRAYYSIITTAGPNVADALTTLVDGPDDQADEPAA